jgi:hypothetical protein
MTAQKHIRYGVTFAASLVIAWTLLTPTTVALRLHRRLNDLVTTIPGVPDRIVRDLANMRWLFLMFGSMAGMAAVSLILSR